MARPHAALGNRIIGFSPLLVSADDAVDIRISGASASATSAKFGTPYSASYLPAPRGPPGRYPIPTTSVPLLIRATSTTPIVDVYMFIKAQLSWLSSILNENGILNIIPGDYKLAVNNQIKKDVECSKTPGNGTAGVCTSLENCPQVFPLLTDANVFKEYVCLSDKLAGICCPRISP